MNNSFGAFFGGLLAIVLLAIFSISTWYMIFSVIGHCKPPAGVANFVCSRPGAELFSEGFRNVVTTVGGLVSALVIAQLSVTEPGATPRVGHFVPTTETGQFRTNLIIVGYLLVWLATGVAALVVGVMLYPQVSSTVSDIGSTWLGLAVSAAYAYFGIRPSGGPPAEQLQREEAVRRQAEMERNAAVTTASVVDQLKTNIANGRIIFDPGKESQLKGELLGTAIGTVATAKLQSLVLSLSNTVPLVRISSIVRTEGHHGTGRAVDIGNEDIAGTLLPLVATDAKVAALAIDEIIFDAKVAGKTDRNFWNYDVGAKHAYDTATLDKHMDHIHFAVTA